MYFFSKCTPWQRNSKNCIERSSSVSIKKALRYLETSVQHLRANSMYSSSSVKVGQKWAARQTSKLSLTSVTNGSSCTTIRFASTPSSMGRMLSHRRYKSSGYQLIHNSRHCILSRYQLLNSFFKTRL